MSKLGILAATALSLTLALAAPASAAGRGGGGGAHFGGGGGAHFGGGGMRMGGGTAAFRGAQASMGPRVGAVSGGARFAPGGFRDHDRRGFGAGAGFVVGLAAGSALDYGYGYDPSYYGPDYAYDDSYYDGGYPVDQGYVASPGYVVSGGADPAYCAQRYRSYDPASGTYLGYDGLRHPCGE
jgi:BA14K-like protein